MWGVGDVKVFVLNETTPSSEPSTVFLCPHSLMSLTLSTLFSVISKTDNYSITYPSRLSNISWVTS